MPRLVLLRLNTHLATHLAEFFADLVHAALFLVELGRVVADLLGDFHRAEVGDQMLSAKILRRLWRR